MRLSAKERRQWRELERQLAAEDPRLAQLTGGRGIARHTAGSPVGLGMVLVAFTVLILAVIVKIPLVGIFGFVLMIFGGTRIYLSGHEGRPAKGSAQARGDIG